MKIIRSDHLAEKIVFVDGLWGCGKTMLSPIISALDRVELLTYTYEIEYICSLFFLKKISNDGAETMIRMLTDLQLYNSMMSREINFRPSDISSVFNYSQPQKYFERILQKGDENIIDEISKKKPILNFATHNLLGFSEPIFSALKNRVVFIEVVRHPLYMIKQIALNMEKLISDIRDFTICFSYQKKQMPYYLLGWEDLYLNSNYMDKAIHYIDRLSRITESKKLVLNKKYSDQIITIPFEKFVLEPQLFIPNIEQILNTKKNQFTNEMLKKQKVPREKYSGGIDLEIYKRCGWEPSNSVFSENDEFQYRREFVAKSATSNAMNILDKLCADYEIKYMNGKIINNGTYE